MHSTSQLDKTSLNKCVFLPTFFWIFCSFVFAPLPSLPIIWYVYICLYPFFLSFVCFSVMFSVAEQRPTPTKLIVCKSWFTAGKIKTTRTITKTPNTRPKLQNSPQEELQGKHKHCKDDRRGTPFIFVCKSRVPSNNFMKFSLPEPQDLHLLPPTATLEQTFFIRFGSQLYLNSPIHSYPVTSTTSAQRKNNNACPGFTLSDENESEITIKSPPRTASGGNAKYSNYSETRHNQTNRIDMEQSRVQKLHWIQKLKIKKLDVGFKKKNVGLRN